MDLERSPPASSAEAPGDGGGGGAAACSICLDAVLARSAGRSVAKLQCGHEFHLDCIGSAFNAKGAMQCPNCRKIEKGRWLYASGHRASVDIDMGGWVTSDNYDITSELPFGFQWCPFSGFTRLASMFE
ncbi:RING/U-box superfamily protein [Zea mays]|nr:RING/U-box superfamily protein [Zea mays]